MRVAVRILPGLVDYDPMQLTSESLLHRLLLVVSLLRAFAPIKFAFAVCVAVRILPGLVDYDPIQFHCCIDLYWLYHCCMHLLPIKFAFAVCVAVRILPGLVDYDPVQLHCCIDLYWLYHCCVHLLLSSLLLLCEWLFTFYLAWLIMTPCNFIAA